MKRLLLITALLSACGTQAGTTKNPNTKTQSDDGLLLSSAYAVSSLNDLPECDDEHRGALYFVESSEEFKVCRKTGWDTIDLRGEAGINGKDGKNGVNGKNGTDGTDGVNGVTGATGATGATGVTGAAGGLAFKSRTDCVDSTHNGWIFQYQAIRFSDDSLFVSCAAMGTANQASQTLLYDATQVGSEDGFCSVVFDTVGNDYAGWTFTLNPLRIVYDDNDSQSTDYVHTYAQGSCSVIVK